MAVLRDFGDDHNLSIILMTSIRAASADQSTVALNVEDLLPPVLLDRKIC